MIVVDASVLAPALADDSADGDCARARLAGETLADPELIDLEVSSVLRHLVLGGQLPMRRADLALTDLSALPLHRVTHRPLLARCWSLRDNLTTYDACYVVMAEQLAVRLVTADARMARAAGPRCEAEVLTHRQPGEPTP